MKRNKFNNFNKNAKYRKNNRKKILQNFEIKNKILYKKSKYIKNIKIYI